jgi:hypothetical protein
LLPFERACIIPSAVYQVTEEVRPISSQCSVGSYSFCFDRQNGIDDQFNIAKNLIVQVIEVSFAGH